MAKTFTALICGYGVPKDLATDPNYQAYLHAVVNALFVRHGDDAGTIVLNGGATDLHPPHARTEAGEMKRWLVAHKTLMSRSAHQRPWKILAKARSLTMVENLLNFAPLVKGAADVLIFCEATRAPRVRRLAREIPALRQAKIIAIDFDTSPRRYNLEEITRQEKRFLALELPALADARALARLRSFAKEKLRLMRQYSPEEAHRRLPEILAMLENKKPTRGRRKSSRV